MDYNVNVCLKPKTAAKLMLIDAVELNSSLSQVDAELILSEFMNLSINEILKIIDEVEVQNNVGVASIPQFGNRVALMKVPSILMKVGVCGINYAQLGYRLKKDVNASVEANTKFGENHGKAASILGIARIDHNKFYANSFGEAFDAMGEENKKNKLVTYLCFRIPIIQIILKEAKDRKINGYEYMIGMTTSTKKRRAQCLRGILKEMYLLNDIELKRRIENIVWDMEEEMNEKV